MKLQKEALSILLEASKRYHLDWGKNCIYDLFLVYFCVAQEKYELAFKVCQHLLQNHKEPIPEALSFTACLEGLPKVSEISEEAAIDLAMQAFTINRSPRAASKLLQIYKRQGQTEQASHWGKICAELAQKGHKEQIMLPEVLRDPRIEKHIVSYLGEKIQI